MRPLIPAAMAVLLAAGDASAQTVAPSISSFEIGAVCAGGDGTFVADTRTIPAALGVGFGIKAQAADPAGFLEVVIEVEPPIAPEPGVEGEPAETPEEDALASAEEGVPEFFYPGVIRGDEPSGFYFIFEGEGELVPGLWTVTARDGDATLYNVEVTVVPAAESDPILAACAG